MIWLDPSKAVCVGLRYSWGGYQYPLQAKRIKHPDLPGPRWMRRAKKGTSQMFYSLIRDARYSRDDCYLLPTQQQWDERQQRLLAAA
jgi:hypothetical protein